MFVLQKFQEEIRKILHIILHIRKILHIICPKSTENLIQNLEVYYTMQFFYQIFEKVRLKTVINPTILLIVSPFF